MKKYFLNTFLLLLFFDAAAQEKFNLKECIAYGMENHRSTTISKNNIIQATAQRKNTLSGYLPSVTLNGSVDDNLKVQEQIIPAGLFGDEDVRVAFTKKFTTNANVQLEQTLFDQSLIIGLRASKFQKEEAELSALENEELLIYNISVAYYQILVYEEQLKFLSENKEVYNKQVLISQLQVDKGILAEVELNKVKVNLSNTMSQIRVAETNLQYSKNALKNKMGFPIAESLDIVSQPLTEISLVNTTVENSFSAQNRIDFQLATVNTKLLEVDYKRLKGDYLPKLSFYAKYGINGFGDDLNQSFNETGTFAAIGVKLSAQLFNGFSKKSQSQIAKIDYENAIENLKIDEENYKLEAENAKTKLTQAQISIEEEFENINLAKSVLESTNLQYQKGVAGLTDWLNANGTLKESQNNYLNSVVDYYIAQIELEKANGTLKSYYNNLK